MTNYVKCPHCDLNYIQAHEKYCKACDPKMRCKFISDAAREDELQREAKWEQHNIRKQTMQDYYAYRYNRKNG